MASQHSERDTRKRYKSEKPQLEEGNGLANKLSRVNGAVSRYFRVFRRNL